MKCLRLAIRLCVLLVAFVWVGLETAPGVSPIVQARQLAGMRDLGASGVQVQNLSGSQSATINWDFYRIGDDLGPKTVVSPNVPAGAAANQFMPEINQLRDGLFSGLVGADRPIGAIVRTDWFSTGGAALYSDVKVGPEVALPLTMLDYAGTSSVVFVQNANPDTAASIQVELRATGVAKPVLVFDIEVAGGHAQMLDLLRDPRFADVRANTELGFLGSMMFRSQEPIGVQSYVDFATSDRAVMAFEGVPTDHAATTLYAPLIRSRFFGYDTGISVVNPGTEAAEVTVRYSGGGIGPGGCDGVQVDHGPISIAAGSSAVFYQGPGGGSGLPESCVGSAVIEASRPVLAVVNDSLNFTQQSAAYNAVRAEDAGELVALPLVRRQHVDKWKLTTGIQVMNVGDERATVTITFKDDQGNTLTGCGSACVASVAPRGSHTFYPGANGLNVFPAGTFGSATITSDRPVVTLVQDASEIGVVDMATYMGIRADVGSPTFLGSNRLALPSLFDSVDHRDQP